MENRILQCFFADSTGIPPASASFPHAFQQSVENPCAEKVPAVSAAFNSCRSGLVESVVESCGMCFPQLVEAVFRVRQVFHDFFHKLLFSTPQAFHFSRVEKAFHFSGNFPQAVCGKDLPEIPRRICGFHFSGASIITTIYSFLCILSFRSFAAKNSG